MNQTPTIKKWGQSPKTSFIFYPMNKQVYEINPIQNVNKVSLFYVEV